MTDLPTVSWINLYRPKLGLRWRLQRAVGKRLLALGDWLASCGMRLEDSTQEPIPGALPPLFGREWTIAPWFTLDPKEESR